MCIRDSAYSFDRDDAGADISYKKMFEAYKKIFSRMALQFRPVEADSGSIGGNFSHEFMVLAETGEDTIAYCTGCDWSANIERAAVLPPAKACEETCAAIEEVTTPDQHTIEEVCGFLKVPAQKLIKTLLYVVDGKPVAALVRGDRELNEIKLKNYFKADEVVLASPEQVTQWTNAPVGFAGPVGFTAGPIVADHELMADTDWIAGANKADTHILHVDLKRDVPAFAYADLRSIAEGDVCPRCGKPVAFAKGIEVGHVFKLGTKYSTALNAIYLDENGKEQTIIMGCYGIGVSLSLIHILHKTDAGGLEQFDEGFDFLFRIRDSWEIQQVDGDMHPARTSFYDGLPHIAERVAVRAVVPFVHFGTGAIEAHAQRGQARFRKLGDGLRPGGIGVQVDRAMPSGLAVTPHRLDEQRRFGQRLAFAALPEGKDRLFSLAARVEPHDLHHFLSLIHI